MHLIRVWSQHWWCNKAISLYLSSFLLLPRQIPGSVESHKELLKQAKVTKKNDLCKFSMFLEEGLVWVRDFHVSGVYADRGSHSLKAQPTWQNS